MVMTLQEAHMFIDELNSTALKYPRKENITHIHTNKWTEKPLSRWLVLYGRRLLLCSPSGFVLMVSQPLALCFMQYKPMWNTQISYTHTHTMSQLIRTNIVQIVVMFINIHYPVSLTTLFTLLRWKCIMFALPQTPGYNGFTFVVSWFTTSNCLILFSQQGQGQWQNEKLTNPSSKCLCSERYAMSWMRTTITNRICALHMLQINSTFNRLTREINRLKNIIKGKRELKKRHK